MRKLLNTLYITTPKSYLSLDGENIVVHLEEEEKFRMPFVNLEAIVCFGYMGASPALMGKCADENISLNFLSPNGEFLARITGKTRGNVMLRKKQYLTSENDEFSLNLSKEIVAAKLFNSRKLLERFIRENKDNCDTNEIAGVSKQLKENIEIVYKQPDKDALRGLEGASAKLYFSVFDQMILKQRKEFSFSNRSKRPPLDNVNCMLSYLYTILALDIASALETVGIDPYIGFLHEIRIGRASLALDLLEELRAYLVDRCVLSMINLNQVNGKDFFKKEGGGILMTDEGRKKLLTCWQERKREIIKHTVIEEKIEIGLLPYVQAQLLARYLRGDLEEYPVFLSR